MITDNEKMITDNREVANDRDNEGRFITEKLPFPYIDDFNYLSMELRQRLLAISLPARTKKRLSNEIMDEIILELCKGHFIPLSIVAVLVNRTSQNIREKQLSPLVEQGKLSLAFPYAKRHKKQGYITSTITDN